MNSDDRDIEQLSKKIDILCGLNHICGKCKLTQLIVRKDYYCRACHTILSIDCYNKFIECYKAIIDNTLQVKPMDIIAKQTCFLWAINKMCPKCKQGDLVITKLYCCPRCRPFSHCDSREINPKVVEPKSLEEADSMINILLEKFGKCQDCVGGQVKCRYEPEHFEYHCKDCTTEMLYDSSSQSPDLEGLAELL